MTIRCPTCSIALSQCSIGGETVDRCPACNGTWYEPSELASALRTATAVDLIDRPSVNPPDKITCLNCDIEVTSTVYAYDSGIPILKCSRCSGVWLVAGQLEKIAEYKKEPHKTDRLGQAMAESNSRSNGIGRFVGVIQSRILSILFALAILIGMKINGAEFFGVLRMPAFLIFPLACIWFSDAMGNLTGIRMGLARPAITETTPGIAVAIGGWILMFAALGVMIYGMAGR